MSAATAVSFTQGMVKRRVVGLLERDVMKMQDGLGRIPCLQGEDAQQDDGGGALTARNEGDSGRAAERRQHEKLPGMKTV